MENEKLGCLTGPVLGLWNWLDARVKGAHSNWMQVASWVVGAGIAFAVAWYFLPDGQAPPPPPGPAAVTDAEGRNPLEPEPDEQAAMETLGPDGARSGTPARPEAVSKAGGRDPPEPEPAERASTKTLVPDGARRRTPAGPAGDCDSDYALRTKIEFRELIEAELRQCVRLFDHAMELYYSCRVEDGIYAVSLKFQYSGTVNDERLPFAAEYRGPREIDKTRVKVTPLAPDFQRLCREKARASRQ